jgi:1-acyl-sn-glycerol-3-phosphate acyltransferase
MVVAAFAVVWALLPVLMVAALAVDATRSVVRRGNPWMAVRLLAFGALYLAAEAVALVVFLATWIIAGRRRETLKRMTFAIQGRWAGILFWAVRRIFGIRVEGRGLEAVVPAPFLLLARHTSIVDNLLPAHFISRPHGTHLRYVMKEELLVDPALDIAGNRLPNYFVRRTGGESEAEVAAIRGLAETLRKDEGILIYPEGTRFTATKRQAALSRMARSNPRLHELAGRLRAVMPPRLGGTLALLEGCAADVVVMAHRGLDGFARVADVWRGGMVGARVEVEFWRIPRRDIPEGRAARAEWLYRLWQDVDDWVTSRAWVGTADPAGA